MKYKEMKKGDPILEGGEYRLDSTGTWTRWKMFFGQPWDGIGEYRLPVKPAEPTVSFPADWTLGDSKEWLVSHGINPRTGRWEFDGVSFFWTPMGAESVWPK